MIHPKMLQPFQTFSKKLKVYNVPYMHAIVGELNGRFGTHLV